MTNTAPVLDAQHARAWNRYFAWVFLGLIIALALFIRVYGISRESVWWDEFSSAVHLDPPEEFRAMPGFEQWEANVGHKYAPDFATFWRNLAQTSPQRFPLYYYLEYAWNRYVSASPDNLRIMSLSFSMLTLLVVYLLGRDLFGSTAGLIAALCFALSPIHRYYAQEIREYAAVTLCALLSAYTFIHVIRTGTKVWWVLHIMSNMLLLSTQLFAVCALPVEVAFLVLTRRPSVRGAVMWGAIHFLLAIPWVFFVMRVEFVPVQITAYYMKVPPLLGFVGDVLADDCIGLSGQLRPTPDVWNRWFPAERGAAILGACSTVGWSAVGLFLAGVAWLLIRTSLSSWHGSREDSDKRWWLLFLLMWLIIPPLILYVASIVLRPCAIPRYTIYASLAMYLIIGALIAGMRTVWMRAICMCYLLLFYGYQQSLTFLGPARVDYKGATQYIRAQLQPADCILVRNVPVGLWESVFAYTFGPTENIMSDADNDEMLAELSDFVLGLPVGPQTRVGDVRTVWAVLLGWYFGQARSPDFEFMLRRRHLGFSCMETGGIQHLAVYAIRPGPGWTPTDSFKGFSGGIETETALRELAQKGDVNGAIQLWRSARPAYPTDPARHFQSAISLMDLQLYDDALAEFRRALEITPNLPAAHERIGFIYLRRDDTEKAIAELEKATALDPAFVQAHMELAEAYAAKNNLQAAIMHWRKVLDLDPRNVDAYHNLAVTLYNSTQ